MYYDNVKSIINFQFNYMYIILNRPIHITILFYNTRVHPRKNKHLETATACPVIVKAQIRYLHTDMYIVVHVW